MGSLDIDFAGIAARVKEILFNIFYFIAKSLVDLPFYIKLIFAIIFISIGLWLLWWLYDNYDAYKYVG